MLTLFCASLSVPASLPEVVAIAGSAQDSVSSLSGTAAKERLEQAQAAPRPTLADVPHRRQKMDLWQAASSAPSLMVSYIHVGGCNSEGRGNVH